jgi:hypothetical protein
MPRLSPEELAARKAEAIDLAVTTFDALAIERGESGKIWASMLKEAMKRRKPDFNESHFGFRSFSNLLEEAQARGLLEIGKDEKSGTYVARNTISLSRPEPELVQLETVPQEGVEIPPEEPVAEGSVAEIAPVPARRRTRGRGKAAAKETALEATKDEQTVGQTETASAETADAQASPETNAEPAATVGPEPVKPAAARARRSRKPKAAAPATPDEA